jgi:hypothetical protein
VRSALRATELLELPLYVVDGRIAVAAMTLDECHQLRLVNFPALEDRDQQVRVVGRES